MSKKKDSVRVEDQRSIPGSERLEPSLSEVLALMPGAAFSFRLVGGHPASMPWASDSLHGVTGVPAQDLVADAQSLLARIHPDDLELVLSCGRASETNASCWQTEFRYAHPRKGEVWLEWRARQSQSDTSLWHGILCDVTERKQAALRQQEQERFQQTLVNCIVNAGMQLMVIEDGRIVRTDNRTLTTLFGYSAEEVAAGVPFEQIVHPDDRPRVEKYHARRCAGEADVPDSYEAALVTRDGLRRDYKISVAVLPDTASRRMIALGKEVGARKRDERELTLLRNAFSQSAASFFVIELKSGRFVDVNEAACAQLGYSRNEMLGMRPADIDPDFSQEMLVQSVRASAMGKAHVFESRHQRRDGHIYPVEITTTLFSDGDALYLLAVARDITERKRIELELLLLQKAFNRLSDCLFIIGRDRRFVIVNDAACRMLGYSREELLSLTPLDIDPELSSERLSHLMSATQSGGTLFESVHRTKDGRIVPVEVNGLVLDSDGRRYAVTLARDITSRKRVEDTLRFIADPGSPNFLEALAKHLGEALGVAYVLIDRIGDESSIADTAAIYAKGEIIPNMRYALADTPCDNVMGKRACSYPSDVQRLFPKDLLLGQMGVESYAAVPLWDSAGNPIGLIAVLDSAPMQDEATVLKILQLVAPRAAVELERGRNEALLMQREEMFRALAENLPDPVIRYDLSGRRIYLNDAAYRTTRVSREEAMGGQPGQTNSLSPADVEKVRRCLRETALQRQPTSCEVEFLTREGLRIYQSSFVPEFDRDGKVAGVLGISRDITPIRESEQRLKSFVDRLPGLAYVFRLGPDGAMSFPYASPGIEDLYGLKPEDIQYDASALHAMAHPEDRPRIEAAIAESARTMLPFRIESRICRPDGSERWVDVRSVPMRQADDGSLLWNGIMLDITERKAAERNLELLRHAVEQASDALFVADALGRFLVVNTAACRSLGYTRDELIGLTPLDIDPDITAEALERVDTFPPGPLAAMESRHRTKAGEIFPVEITSTKFLLDGATYVVSTVRDITERKRILDQLAKRERAFRSLAESSPDSVIRYDREQRMLYLNTRLMAKLGVASLDDVVGKRPIEVWPDGRYGGLDQASARAMSTGEKQTIEFSDVVTYGEPRYHQIDVVPEYDGDGKVIGSIAFGRDITPIRVAEQALKHFVDNLPGLAFTLRVSTDGQARFTYLSRGIEALFGLRAADVQADSRLLYELIHPEDRQRIVEAAVSPTREMATLNAELRVCAPNAQERWLEVRAAPELLADGSYLWYGIMLDVAARKAAEQGLRTSERQFRMLAENSPDHVIRYDRECRIVYFNHRLALTLGVSVEEAIGRTSRELTPEPAYESYIDAVERVAHSGEPAIVSFVVPDTPIGPRYQQVSLVAERDEHGEPIGVLGIGRDVTDMMQTQLALEQSQSQLRALVARNEDVREDERRRIAREVHDELGQTLTALQLGLSRIDRKFGAEQPALREHVLESLDTVNSAIATTRSIASALRPMALDMGIATALEWMGRQFSARTNVSCRVHVSSRAADLDEPHAVGIYRIAQEAITNIVRHAAAKAVVVILGRRGGNFVLTVRDDGDGFDVNAVREGALGLLGIRERALMLGGTVSIDSKLGRGTTVTVRIPAQRSE